LSYYQILHHGLAAEVKAAAPASDAALPSGEVSVSV
jgi:hypothetical protein